MNWYSDDLHCVKRIANDDKDAFEALFNTYWEPLFAAALQRLQCKELAKDVVQGLFVEIWEKRKSLRIKSNVQAYLFTALKHRVLNRIKKDDVRLRYEKKTEHFYKVNDWATEHQVDVQNLRDELHQNMNRLPRRCREVFELSRKKKLTHKEIARKLDIAPKTVENHIARALKRLRPHLKRLVSISLLIIRFI